MIFFETICAQNENKLPKKESKHFNKRKQGVIVKIENSNLSAPALSAYEKRNSARSEVKQTRFDVEDTVEISSLRTEGVPVNFPPYFPPPDVDDNDG